jgi:hypothetical protein
MRVLVPVSPTLMAALSLLVSFAITFCFSFLDSTPSFEDIQRDTYRYPLRF